MNVRTAVTVQTQPAHVPARLGGPVIGARCRVLRGSSGKDAGRSVPVDTTESATQSTVPAHVVLDGQGRTVLRRVHGAGTVMAVATSASARTVQDAVT